MKLRASWAAALLCSAALAAAPAFSAELAYDEAADAPAQVQHALDSARAGRKPVLVIFGANWCPDCRALDQAVKSGRNAELLRQRFEVVKVDVGRFDRNLELAARYGNPIKKGIPAAVILSPDDRVLYATRAGELADARRMNEGDVHTFFSKAAAQAK